MTALDVVRTRMHSGLLPSATEYGELLREVGFTPAEARPMYLRYAEAVAEESVPSGESSVLSALKNFSLGHLGHVVHPPKVSISTPGPATPRRAMLGLAAMGERWRRDTAQ